jgi:pyrimidine-specific ribonucleoside hydrolase
MIKIAAIAKVLLLGLILNGSVGMAQSNQKPVPVIFDTDMGPDYDDVGAITLLHAFADKGEATILATIASTKYENVGAVLNVLNTYFKRPDLPIGVPRGEASILRDFQHWSDTLVARYPHAIKSNAETMDAVELYRKILVQQPDNSVTIITVGFLTNISNLLQSKADQHSPLTGAELVNKKVNKLVSMAGKFPSGKEFNVEIDAKASIYVFKNFKKPIILSGFEIGAKIKTGLPLIHNAKIKNSPVKDVFRISIPMDKEDKEGRMSWDQTAVLVGVRGHEPYYKYSCGTLVVNEDGSNAWSDKGKNHCYLIEKQPASVVQNVINELMMHQP